MPADTRHAAPRPQPLRRPEPRRSLRRDRRSRRRPRAARSWRRSPTRSAGTRRPGAKSDIPAGATYLTQFVVHDLDFPTRDARPAAACSTSALIYGDGPKHDAFCYQVPAEAGAGAAPAAHRPRPADADLAGLGRGARPAAHLLPATSTPAPVETRTEVLVPNSFSDSNALLGAGAGALGADAQRHRRDAGRDAQRPSDAFEQARRINRGIYRDVIRHDVLGTWLMPRFRDRYTGADAAAGCRRRRSAARRASSWPASAGSGTGWCARSMR